MSDSDDDACAISVAKRPKLGDDTDELEKDVEVKGDLVSGLRGGDEIEKVKSSQLILVRAPAVQITPAAVACQ